MKYCIKCNRPMEDNQNFCAACGASQLQFGGAARPTGAPTSYSAPVNYSNPPSYSAPASDYSNPGYSGSGYSGAPSSGSGSTWDASVFDTFVAGLAASLIMTLTCGIATPWAVCYMWRFIVSHAIIDGKRMTFDGNGGALLGNWIVWMLLTVITCGIYSFWVIPKMYKWIASHTHFA